MKTTYAELFDYLQERLLTEPCDHTLRHTLDFAKQHDLSFKKLSQMLSDFGGNCDCEVTSNVVLNDRIDRREQIGHETFTTPREFAMQNEMYCHCRVNGQPVSCESAVESRKASQDAVEMWVRCKPSDPFATLDFNRALLALEEAKNLSRNTDVE